MPDETNGSDRRLLDCLNNSYPIKVVALTPLPLGADLNASVYRAQTREMSSCFVKLKCGCAQDVGSQIIQLISDAGIRQVISPIRTNDGKLFQLVDDDLLIVYPFIEGVNGFVRDLTNDQWVSLGQVLRQVHNTVVPPSIKEVVRRENYSPKWRDAVRSLCVHIESKPCSDEIGLQLISFMKEHAKAIHRLTDRAEQLAQILQGQAQDFVLCHSDFHAGNILIDNSDNLYVVDWDDPIMAPKERDLMFVGGGVANLWNKAHEGELFYKGYGEAEIDATALAYYRHERIVEDIAVYGQQLLLTTAGGEDRINSHKQFISQFEPNGVVDIAFNTDEDS